MPGTMRAAVFKDVRDIHLEQVPYPTCGPTDAIVKVTTTTICGTDSHIWRGEYPVAPGRGEWRGGMAAELAANYLHQQLGLAVTQRATGKSPTSVRALFELALSVLR